MIAVPVGALGVPQSFVDFWATAWCLALLEEPPSDVPAVAAWLAASSARCFGRAWKAAGFSGRILRKLQLSVLRVPEHDVTSGDGPDFDA